jgi:hypothetical protein
MDEAIRFRPIPPRSPHLNGKVERAQRTTLEEFWAATDPKAVDVADHRSHESLHGDTPIDRVCRRADKTPLWAAVSDAYDPAKEHIQIRQHAVEMALRTLIRSESSPSVTKGEHRAYSIILARAAASDKKSRPPLTRASGNSGRYLAVRNNAWAKALLSLTHGRE